MNGLSKQNWKKLGQIFWAFCKIGPVSFGGGYAMIPFFEREIVEKRRWLAEEDVADIFAVSQSTPGAIAINSATFVGYRLAGVPGAIAALLGVLLPTFLIVLCLCFAFLAIRDQPKVEAALKGIRPAIVAMIAYAGIRVGKTALIDKTTFVTAAATIALLLFTGMNPAIVILIGVFLGIALVKLKEKLGMAVPLGHSSQAYEDSFFGEGI